MSALAMPEERHFGWALKPTSSTHFEIHKRPNGQFCVVLNHSLLRGVTSEMIHWWFLHFPVLNVKLIDIEGYENTSVQSYLLWHPSDHHSVSLQGELAPDNTSKAGATIHIREAMQYLKYGWKFPVDNQMKIFYCESDGWAMGKEIPILGKAMVLRIHYKDVYENDRIIGVHYHYEIVIGLSGNNPLAKLVNKKIAGHFSPEFFEAWHLHNTIEVGTFENFLPALYDQRKAIENMEYRLEMDCAVAQEEEQIGFDHKLFERRLKGFRDASDVHKFQGFNHSSFLG